MEASKRRKLTHTFVTDDENNETEVIDLGSGSLEHTENNQTQSRDEAAHTFVTDDENNETEVIDLGSGSLEHTENNQTQSRDEAGNLTDKEQLKALMATWGVTVFQDNLTCCGINYKNFKFLEETDYAMLLKNEPKLGEMIVFRHFHRQWKNNTVEKIDSKPQGHVIDVKHLLDSGGEIAHEIKTFFESNNYLIDTLRLKLIHLILKKKCYLSRSALSNIADQICNIFPGEVKRVYYEKLSKKDPTGLLYQEYCKTRRTKGNPRSITNEENTEENTDDLLTDDVRSSIDIINNEESDETVIINHSELTRTYRKNKAYKNVDDVINDWLPLRRSDGYFLIALDFSDKYGSECAQSLEKKWEDFAFTNHNVILEDCKEPQEKKTLLEAHSANDENIKDRIIMMALHHLSYLMPSKFTGKKVFTPTVPESKNAFFKVVKNSQGIVDEMKRRNTICKEQDIKEHPMIFESKNADNVQYFVGVSQTVYKCDSFIEAVDTAFKIFVLYKIPFPPECMKIWQFLNEIFYKIELQQKPCAKIISILNSYEF